MLHSPVLIIGAGPAGLSAGYELQREARILERSHEVGGLARSVELDDGLFDIGGHSFHTPHPRVLSLVKSLMDGNWSEQQRDAQVFYRGQLIPYPFQHSFEHINDPDVVQECRNALPLPGSDRSFANYEEWIISKFGHGVARHFMFPYNRKLWARDLRSMSCEWVAERVAGAGTPGKKDRRQPLLAESVVGYPEEGGFGRIFEAMAASGAPVDFGVEVIEIDPARRTVRSKDGRSWHYDRLISTMVLPELLKLIVGCPSDLIEAAAQLQFVSLKVLLILIGDPLHNAPQRLYVADPDVLPHKLAFNHKSSASLRSRDTQALIAEVSFSSEKSIPADEELCPQTIEWLSKQGVIPGGTPILATKVLTIRYGYPVYTHARAKILSRILPYLLSLGIHSIGRFGAWQYINSDECIRQGLETADILLSGHAKRSVFQ
jgi:protoporphyrinogen oxidase